MSKLQKSEPQNIECRTPNIEVREADIQNGEKSRGDQPSDPSDLSNLSDLSDSSDLSDPSDQSDPTDSSDQIILRLPQNPLGQFYRFSVKPEPEPSQPGSWVQPEPHPPAAEY